MRRAQDWPRRLAAAIGAARAEPFSWGRHDCALFAADVVQRMTGVDLAAAWRGRYDTRTGALRVLAELGGLEAAVSVALGAPRSHATLAQRGDVVMVDTEDGPALGVCNGATAACAGPDGRTDVPMPLWKRAWRV